MNQNNNIKLSNRRICLKIKLGSNNTRICTFSIGFNVKVIYDYLPQLKYIFKKDMVKQFILTVFVYMKFNIIIAIQ